MTSPGGSGSPLPPFQTSLVTVHEHDVPLLLIPSDINQRAAVRRHRHGARTAGEFALQPGGLPYFASRKLIEANDRLGSIRFGGRDKIHALGSNRPIAARSARRREFRDQFFVSAVEPQAPDAVSS